MRGVNVKHESERARSVRLFSEHSFHPCLKAALAAVVILAFSTPIFAQAAKNKKPAAAPQPKSEREQANAQVFGRLAQAWAAVFSGKSQEAITLAEPVAKLSDPDYKWAAIEAAHLQARAYHQSGTAQGRARAAQLWKQIERLDTSKATKARLQIAKALEAEARGTAIPAAGAGAGSPAKPAGDPSAIKQAIDTLEPLLKAGRWNLVEAEAALDLSRLYVQANRFDDAKKTLDYIVAYLGVKKNLIVLEIPPGLEKPYIAAAKAAIAHLKYDKNIGLAEFEAAEKLRKAGKFADAARAYQAVIAVVKNFPESDYGPRSDLHVGDCLMGLGQTARAIEHWKKFIAPAPAGPWRGQAYIGIIDYCLEEQLDLPEAGKYADIARNSLPAALADHGTGAAGSAAGAGRGMGVPPMRPTGILPVSPTGILPVSGSPRSAVPSGTPVSGSPVPAAASWSLVAFDIHLRVGLVSFCQGNSAQAVSAFQSAKALATSKATAESLDSLISAAKSGKAVIPDDCRGMGVSPMSPTAVPAVSSPDRPALALSMAVIHLLAGRYDNADNMFDRMLGPNSPPSGRGKGEGSPSGIIHLKSAIGGQRPPLPGSSPAQLSFATFGRGAVLQARRKTAAAKAQFLASIKAFRDGSWHDETLYRLATITQDEADAKFGKADEPAKDSPKPEIRNPQSAIRNQERLAAFIKAKSEALPYWQEIISRYPKSPRCEQAFYNAGVLLCEIAEAADAPGLRSSKSGANWKDAAFMLGRFTEFYPKSPYAGDAYVREIDIAMERMFDLSLATAATQSAVVWANATSKLPITLPNVTNKTDVLSTRAWYVTSSRPPSPALNDTLHALYLQAGLVSYLERQYDNAIALFKAAEPFAPPPNLTLVYGYIPTGIEQVISAAKAKRALTPDEVLTGDKRTALILQVADIYYEAMAYERSLTLCAAIDAHNTPAAQASQLSWALFMKGRNLYALEDMARAREAYRVILHKYPASPWSDRALFYSGCITKIADNDPRGAIKYWQSLLAKHPESPLCEKTSYYIAVVLEWNKDWAEAKKAYEQFLKSYPDSCYVRPVKEYHLPRAIRGVRGEQVPW